MEKQAKYIDNKILKFLPKAVSVVTFHHNLPFSPNRDKRFSGPINVPMIPHEARIRRPKSFNLRKSNDDIDHDDHQEPTSPKISCMGQIKLKNKKIINKNKRVVKEPKPVTWSPREVKKQASALKRILSGAIKPGRKSSASACTNSSSVDDHDRDDDHLSSISRPSSFPDRAPALSQMRRFASGRDSMAGFDWAAAVQVTPVDADHQNSHYSDDDDHDHDRNFDFDDDDFRDEVKIPFSAPIAIGSESTSAREEMPMQPRKEINLWKRRTMAPPRPLDLDTKMIRAK